MGEGVMQNCMHLVLLEVTNVTLSIICGHFVWLSPMVHYGCKCAYKVYEMSNAILSISFMRSNSFIFLVYSININQCLFLIRCLGTLEFDDKSLLNQKIDYQLSLLSLAELCCWQWFHDEFLLSLAMILLYDHPV